MKSDNNYLFKGLLLFGIFGLLYEVSYFVNNALNSNSNGLSTFFAFVSFFLAFICLIGYGILYLDEIYNVK